MRYLPLTDQDREEMLAKIGVADVNDLYCNVPTDEMYPEYDLPDHQGELEVEQHMTALAKQNTPASEVPFFLGAGSYFHHIPATVDHVIQRSEFLTAYTPYQPEISQGTLTTVFEFQTMIAHLTGMEVANASMYDGSTATAEAALMAMRVTRRSNINICGRLHPQYREVLDSYMRNHHEVNFVDQIDEKTACVIVQRPDFYGEIESLEEIRKQCDEVGALLVVVVTEILSLGLLQAPSCADIVVGEAQSIGVPLSYGGPYLGFFASKMKYVRQMPGRICGETTDEEGRVSYVLTLNTREQHIRRQKATSNICTNQGLCATAFTIHLSLLGEQGVKRLARINHANACAAADQLAEIPNVSLVNKTFFNEFCLRLPNAKALVKNLAKKNIVAGYAPDDEHLIVAVTEMVSDEDVKALVNAIKEEVA